MLCTNAFGSFFYHFSVLSVTLLPAVSNYISSSEGLSSDEQSLLYPGFRERKVPGNLDFLREALTNDWLVQEYLCPVSCLLATLRCNLHSRGPLGVRPKPPFVRLHLKSCPFLAISPFWSRFSFSLLGLPWEDFLSKSQTHISSHMAVWF